MTDEKKPVSAYDFPQIYERLGMKLGHFAAIMLDVEPIDVQGILGVDDDWFYYSDKDELRYVKGPVASAQAHCTLLYGITPDDNAGVRQKTSVDELLTGLDLSSVTVDEVDHFPPQYNEPYGCIVAKLKADENLVEANRRLRFLPHIDTFLEFKAHVTLAYVNEEDVQDAIPVLSDALNGTKLPAIGINYGGKIV
jgi:2'-5' RNA ligase